MPIKEIETATGIPGEMGVEDPVKESTGQFRVGSEKLTGDCFQAGLMHVGQWVEEVTEKPEI
jgi:hypothetical protein